MYFDLDGMDFRDSYRLLVNLVVPRPIALVSTIDGAGNHNAAPFSFFNIMGHDPPIVVLGIERRAPGVPKDTLRNMQEGGGFVVNLVNETIATQMNTTARSYPTGVDELAKAGLTAEPGRKVAAPRVAESPVNLECTVRQVISLGEERSLVIGDVRALHLADEFYDAERRHVLTEKLGLIARMHGTGWYARTSDLFLMERVDEPD